MLERAAGFPRISPQTPLRSVEVERQLKRTAPRTGTRRGINVRPLRRCFYCGHDGARLRVDRSPGSSSVVAPHANLRPSSAPQGRQRERRPGRRARPLHARRSSRSRCPPRGLLVRRSPRNATRREGAQ
jgi:hypothetical protein